MSNFEEKGVASDGDDNNKLMLRLYKIDNRGNSENTSDFDIRIKAEIEEFNKRNQCNFDVVKSFYEYLVYAGHIR